MPRHSSRIALALVLALGATPLLAAPVRTARAVTPTAPAGAVQQLWNGLVALWNAAGCIADPDGIARCVAVAGSSSAPLPEGCVIDPNGVRCAATTGRSTAPAGCIGDPDGIRCASVSGSSVAQRPPAGCIGDPNGLCVSQH